MILIYPLLAGGYRPSIARLAFTPPTASTDAKLALVSESPVPNNPSWVEGFPPHGAKGVQGKVGEGPGADAVSISRAYSLSEDGGLAVSLKVKGDGLEVTSTQKTYGGPCHVHILADHSAIVISNYVGGSLTLHPLLSDGTLGEAKPQALPFAYDGKAAPNTERQDASHAHGVVEHDGLLYAADLGSDRVYVVERAEGETGLKVAGWIQCEAGFGPRHCVVSRDGKSLYVLGELGHAVAAYPLSAVSTDSAPSAGKAQWTQSYLPPNVPKEYTTYMDGAEIALHPQHEVVYASNRLELHAAEKNGLPPLEEVQPGDAVALIKLAKGGEEVEETKWVRTGCCCVRGMQVSPDGKYVIVGGQCNKTVEVYAISQEGMEWTKVASLEFDGTTDFVWM